jgi:hypothetical protein
MNGKQYAEKQRRERESFQAVIADSDAKIRASIAALQGHERGRQVLIDLGRLLNGPATGLDCNGHEAVVTLITEFAKGRRGFLASSQDRDGTPVAIRKI